MSVQPALFVSHGAPTFLVDDGPARRYLEDLGQRLAPPNAILLVSAHHDAVGDVVQVTGGTAPRTVHDFGHFPRVPPGARYPAPGSPALAALVLDMLSEAGIPAGLDATRGLDHGAWVPLSILFPHARTPVVQLSLNTARSSRWHYAMGTALASLRERGVLVIGSGGATHNLRAFVQAGFDVDASPPVWVTEFAHWLAVRVANDDIETVLNAIDRAPHGRRNHPTPEHLLPLFVALGTRGTADRARRLHHSVTHGVLSMDVYAVATQNDLARLTARNITERDLPEPVRDR